MKVVFMLILAVMLALISVCCGGATEQYRRQDQRSMARIAFCIGVAAGVLGFFLGAFAGARP